MYFRWFFTPSQPSRMQAKMLFTCTYLCCCFRYGCIVCGPYWGTLCTYDAQGCWMPCVDRRFYLDRLCTFSAFRFSCCSFQALACVFTLCCPNIFLFCDGICAAQLFWFRRLADVHHVSVPGYLSEPNFALFGPSQTLRELFHV